MRIDELELSDRARNALKRAGIHTTEQLCALNGRELLSTRGVGITIYSDITRRLEEKGLHLRGEETP